MNLYDALVIILFIISLYIGYSLGIVRQFFISVGSLVSFFIAAWLGGRIIVAVGNSTMQQWLAIFASLLLFILLTDVIHYSGTIFEKKVKPNIQPKALFTFGGLIIGGITAIFFIWVTSPILVASPVLAVAAQVQSSQVVAALNTELPPQPSVSRDLSQLLKPFQVIRVFVGQEPIITTATNNTLQYQKQLQATQQVATQSIVRVVGTACGLDSQGTGFFVTPSIVATSAHVIAGVETPKILDSDGSYYTTQPVLFDSANDFALLRVIGTEGKPLLIDTTVQGPGTLAALAGYPGGALTTRGALFVKLLRANSYDIYGQSKITRYIYVLAADIEPGASGEPVVSVQNNKVVGIVFGNSLTQKHTGYALAITPLYQSILTARSAQSVVSTGNCESGT